METPAVSLDDKYALEKGQVYLSGVQALVRLPLLQKARDEANRLETGGFISGYRGSPVGGFDTALIRAQKWLKAKKIHFQPGLNEDLAATSVWGSQQLNLFEGAQVDGVFSMWYGKGPGADRCGDVFKHANGSGTSKFGGVLAIVGDDHGCHSSTMPHQSEQIFIAAMMPVVAPASLQDYLDLGLLGFALSRFSGCWVGIKAVAQTIETSGIVDIDPSRPVIAEPLDFETPVDGLNIRLVDAPLAQEHRLHGPRMAAVRAFAKANQFDRVTMRSTKARVGIVAAGKAYLDVCEALVELGIDDVAAERLGVRLYKIGLVWPLEESRLREFAEGLEEIVVVEEKRGIIEDQIAKILYHDASRPRIVGKTDETGGVLFQSQGEIDPVLVARALGARLGKLVDRDPVVEQNLARLEELAGATKSLTASHIRPPFFCSGCPHNRSTLLPDGSRGMAGIGCHGMIAFMPERRTHLWSHMGGEGLAWVGQAPFTTQRHIFQNLGDGTYSHSGLLAIRAAAASKVNITYKILFNDAVAMTGGQSVEGGLTVAQVCHQVAAEGANKIVIVSDQPDGHRQAEMPAGVTVRHRDELDLVQRELREIEGLTVLVYEQTCAAEKRRRRKRGEFPDPDRRIFINPAVCENCGDCTVKSNCISVQPIETELGRKRAIDQSSCNKDYSCINGFCPSFVSVAGAKVRKSSAQPKGGALSLVIPDPVLPQTEDVYSILVAGIGGTGVITIGALLGMAARLDGKLCTVLDSTGMAQKNGAVMSHVRIGPEAANSASRIPAGRADVVLACDVVVASGTAALAMVRSGSTKIIANEKVVPTAAFMRDRDFDPDKDELLRRLKAAAGAENVDVVPAQTIATTMLGDAIATNSFMLGYAFQKGLVPLRLESLVRAIELNGAAVDMNKEAFAWGRRTAVDKLGVSQSIPVDAKSEPASVEQIMEHRARLLTSYQDERYAARYLDFVAAVRLDEQRIAPGRTDLSKAVALNLSKLMSYKDEYEVARLFSDAEFEARLRDQFEGNLRLTYHLAPPFLAKRDPSSGEPIKRTFGPWIRHVFRFLSKLRSMRGTRLDLFGMTEERRAERAFITEYEGSIRSALSSLTSWNYDTVVEIARIPDMIRGFGHVKSRSMVAAAARRAELERKLHAPLPVATAAE